jgi:hypothetical protein
MSPDSYIVVVRSRLRTGTVVIYATIALRKIGRFPVRVFPYKAGLASAPKTMHDCNLPGEQRHLEADRMKEAVYTMTAP